MKRIETSAVGILQGSRLLFSDFIDGGPMWTGQGDRENRFSIRFSEPFFAVPSVMVHIGLCDMDHQHNMRIDLTADDITSAGFVIVFRTWGDTRVARIRADWMAIGATTSADNWQLY
jgi:hypothetical protein